jgi:hypothetical protein
MCIFVLSAAIVIGILALASIWTVLDYVDVCNFLEMSILLLS